MKSIIIGLSALLLLIGCGKDQPKPNLQVVDVNKSVDKNVTLAPKKIRKKIVKAPKKNVKVPPLPTPEVEIDMDSIVEQATSEVIS